MIKKKVKEKGEEKERNTVEHLRTYYLQGKF